MLAFGLWRWDRVCGSYFLSDRRLFSCIVVDGLFPARRGKYIFIGYPCRLLCDLKWNG